MIKQLFKDSSVYGVSSLLVQGIPILIVPIYTRFLSPGEYGGLDILTIFASLINLTVALEIAQGLARHYPELSSDAEKRSYASTALWFSLAAYSAFAVLALSFSAPLTRLLLDAPSWEKTLRVAIVAMSANGVFLILQNLLRWQLRPSAFAAVNILYVSVMAGSGVLFVMIIDMGVNGIFYGQVIGAAAAGMLAWHLTRAAYTFHFSQEKCCLMLAFSIPLVPSSVAVLAANTIDRFAIQHFLSLDAVGIYGIGFRCASIVNLLLAGLYSALTPIVYQRYQQESTPKELAKVFRYLLAGTLPLLLLVSLFSRELVALFAPPTYSDAWRVIPVLAASSLLMRLYIFAPGLDIAKKTGAIAVINIAAAIANILLNLLFIPFLGIPGAAWATLVAAILMFVSYMVFSQRFYPIPYPWKPILAAVFVTVPLMGGAYYPSMFEWCNSYLSIGIRLVVTLTGAILVLVLLRIPGFSYRR